MAKVAAGFLSAGPVTVELAPSHVIAPAIDADLQGSVDLCGRQGLGRNDDSHARLRQDDGRGQGARSRHRAQGPSRSRHGQGPRQERRRRKPLLGRRSRRDRSIKVNGIPLGKAPGLRRRSGADWRRLSREPHCFEPPSEPASQKEDRGRGRHTVRVPPEIASASARKRAAGKASRHPDGGRGGADREPFGDHADRA